VRLLLVFAIAAAGCGDTAVVLSIAPAAETEIDSFCVDLAADGASRFGERYAVADLARQAKMAPWTLTVFPGARASATARVAGYLRGQEVASATDALAFPAQTVSRSAVTLDRCGAAAGTLAFTGAGSAMAPAAAGALVPGPSGPVAALVAGTALSIRATPDLAERAAPALSGSGSAIAALDLDGDCDVDLVALVDGVPVALLSDAAGGYAADRTALPAAAGVRGLAVGDVDGDGLPDLVACGGASARVLKNGGQGRFAAVPDAFPANDGLADATACVLADFAGAGHLDLAVGQGAAAPAVKRMYFNDGTGHFTYVAAALPPLAERTSALAAADVDGNGAVDLVAAHLGAPVRLYRNGSGVKQGELSDFSFGLPDQAVGDVPSLLLADLDGDCAPDLVIPRAGAAPRVWRNLNDGGGRFEEVPSPGLGAAEAAGAAALDIDGDRVLDLLLVGAQGAALYRQKAAR
jgi:hypothetical protein